MQNLVMIFRHDAVSFDTSCLSSSEYPGNCDEESGGNPIWNRPSVTISEVDSKSASGIGRDSRSSCPCARQ